MKNNAQFVPASIDRSCCGEILSLPPFCFVNLILYMEERSLFYWKGIHVRWPKKRNQKNVFLQGTETDWLHMKTWKVYLVEKLSHDTKEEMQHNKYSFKGNMDEWHLTSDPCIHLPFSGVVLEHLQGYGGSPIISEKDHYQAVHVAYNCTTP